ncbi:hypothetical protein AAFF_G00262620, partial [Aldrovandia affinis]
MSAMRVSVPFCMFVEAVFKGLACSCRQRRYFGHIVVHTLHFTVSMFSHFGIVTVLYLFSKSDCTTKYPFT